jgi:hypothetical protein
MEKSEIVAAIQRMKDEHLYNWYNNPLYVVRNGISYMPKLPKPQPRKRRAKKYGVYVERRKRPSRTTALKRGEYDYTLEDAYMDYRNKTAKTMQVPYSIYIDIMTAYFDNVISILIDKAVVVRLPCGFGALEAKRIVNPIKTPIDYRHYKLTEEVIPLKNEDYLLSEYRTCVRWHKIGVRRSILYKYRIIPCKKHKLRLRASYLSKKIIYPI